MARDLLSESGSIFVQIGDENVHLVRSLIDEVFGPENFVSLITIAKTSGQTQENLLSVTDLILWYGFNIQNLRYRPVWSEKARSLSGFAEYSRIQLPSLLGRSGTREELDDQTAVPAGALFYRQDNLTSQSIGRQKGEGAASWFDVYHQGNVFRPSLQNRWKTNEAGMSRLQKANRLEKRGYSLSYVRLLDDFSVVPISNLWADVKFSSRSEDKVYVVQTSVRTIERCLLMTTDPGDLVLDPTCGSGTTAYIAEQWGRRWITIDTSRVALALARTRLMSARYSYYLLADSPEGVKKEAKITGRTPPACKTESDIRKGFVYKRVPHVTLKSIANNPEIDSIHAEWQEKLGPIRAKLNALLGQSWEEWQIPRSLTPTPSHGKSEGKKPSPAHAGEGGEAQAEPGEGERLLAAWWELRRQRQAQIDASIARNAETELLYDKPYDDPKRVRVAGPFTVESLSPHRVLAADVNRDGEVSEAEAITHADFVATLIEHLRKAGIQNTKKAERLKFDRLENFAGAYIQAEGETTDATGAVKRIALCFGPENGTVGPELIREAAKEAVQGLGFDLLYVLGFAFDPHASEETLRYRRPIVQIAKMNPDLAMGDDLLKKTGSGNLFMVFGEPDVEIREGEDSRLTVEIKGVDVYDPTTGVIRSNSTDDIAFWFIDTDYDAESFFVRHAYFTGADRPYEKLQKTLRAEIDEDAWAAVYSTVSRPFDPPKTGKIAVKVINHYGDEVLKVYAVEG